MEDVYRQSVDFYKQLSSPFPQQLYKSMVQVCTTPYAINYSPDWKLLSILKSTNVQKPGALESRCTLQTLEKALSFLSGWQISERFVDFGHFHFCLLDPSNLGLILILLKSMAKFPLTSKEMA